MRTYGQYCPIARTAELFAERWTPIIVRNLAAGCTTFTQLREGAPGIPKALLADRLSQLERRGVLARTPRSAGRGSVYALTDSGRELKHVCDAMGEWGARWLELEPHHLDPAYVLWATCRLVDVDRIPGRGLSSASISATSGGVSGCFCSVHVWRCAPRTQGARRISSLPRTARHWRCGTCDGSHSTRPCATAGAASRAHRSSRGPSPGGSDRARSRMSP